MNVANFQKHLDDLQQTLQEHAHRFPEHGFDLKNLDWKNLSPDMLHLIYASAYFCSQIEERVNNAPIDNSHHNKLMPYLSTIIPSRLIVFMENHTKDAIIFEKNTQLTSIPVGEEQTTCIFKPIQDEAIVPASIESINCIRDVMHQKIELYISKQAPVSSLKFYINLPLKKAMDLYFQLFNSLSTIDVLSENGELIENHCQILPCYFETIAQPMFDDLLFVFQSFHDLESFPEKFMFFEITNIPNIMGQKSTIRLNLPDLLFDVRYGDLLLNCIPAINLFTSDCEPIFQHPKDHEYPIIVDYNRPKSMKLIALEKITQNGFNQTSKPEDLEKDYSIREDEKGHYFVSHANFKESNVYSVASTNCNVDYPFLYIHKDTILTTASNGISEAQVLVKPINYFSARGCNFNIWSDVVNFLSDPQRFHSIEKLKEIIRYFMSNEYSYLSKSFDNIERTVEKTINCYERGMLCHYNMHEIHLYHDNNQPQSYILCKLLHQLFSRFCPVYFKLMTKVYFPNNLLAWTFCDDRD